MMYSWIEVWLNLVGLFSRVMLKRLLICRIQLLGCQQLLYDWKNLSLFKADMVV